MKNKGAVNVKEEMIKRLHYINADKLNVLFVASIILLQIVELIALGMNNMVLAGFSAFWVVAFTVLVEWSYRRDRDWYRKWTIYRSSLTSLSYEGASFYEGDEKRYRQLAGAME
ncbi:MAG: hypothetical protein ACFFD4_08250 [Candidatus Odinarchaeota archaeon]